MSDALWLWRMAVLFLVLVPPLHAGGTDHHVVFIGDSVLRYQYLSLCFFLEYGKWPGAPNEVDPTWAQPFQQTPEQFHQVSNALFVNEFCDCHAHGQPHRHPVENRYYASLDLDVAVSYFQWYCKTEPRGHLHTAEQPLTCRPGQCTLRPDWILLPHALVDVLLKPLHPSHVVVDMGHCQPEEQPSPEVWQQLCTASRPLQAKGVLFYWASPTPKADDKDYAWVDAPEELRNCGWQVFDRLNAFKDFKESSKQTDLFVDGTHFRAPVYTVFNQLLMRLIGMRPPHAHVHHHKTPPKIGVPGEQAQ